jgi:hypothetical protein
MARIGIILALSIAGSPLCAAADAGQAGAYLRLGVGARAAALGDAMAAAVEGPNAGYWNPAALAQARRPALSSSLSLLSLGRQYNTAALQLAWDPEDAPRPGTFPMGHRAGLGAWSVTWLGFSLGDDFEGRRSDTADFYKFSDRQSAYLLSHGRPLTPWLAVGAGVKLYERVLESFTASGMGVDLGALMLLGPRVRLGVSSSELYSQLRWSTGFEERLPLVLRSSLSFDLGAKVRMAGQVTAIEGRNWEAGAGLEVEPWSGIMGRLGWKGDSPRAGAGFQIPLQAFKIQLDYAYLPDPLRQGDTQRLEIHIYF